MKKVANKIYTGFRNPPGEFRPIPWWCWSGEMNYSEMEKQLREMKDKGISEFFIFAIYGLEIPYMGREWWKKIEWTLKRCKEIEMKVWIYDDYNWPSGTCAGYVLRDHPWAKSQRFKFETFLVRSGATLNLSTNRELIGGVIHSSDGKEAPLRIKEILNKGKLTWKNNYRQDCQVLLIIRELTDYIGQFAYGAEWCTREQGYVDTLNQKAVEKFIQYTHIQYERRFKQYLGNTLKGFFTDEPQISTYKGTYCSSSLFSEFEKLYGYNLKEKIHELVMDIGNYLLTRYQFWSLLTYLFSRSYFKQISEWCEKRKVILTGHLLGEEKLAWNVTYSGDVYETLKWMQVPGMDLLGKETSYNSGKLWSIGKIDRRGLILTAKLISSTARFTGRKRTMCESFGILDWAQTLEEQKRVNDWLCAMGINLINDNLLIYTIRGFRKRAISGKHFTSPWWKYYKKFTDYSGRLCFMCARGKLEAEIGVLYPTTNIWCLMKLAEDTSMNKISGAQSQKLIEIENTLYGTCDALFRIHRDFELLFDEVIVNATTKDGSLVTGNGRFKTIICPAIEILRRDVYLHLCQFVQAGGKLIIVGKSPAFIIDNEKMELKRTKGLDGVIRISYPKDGLKFENILALNIPFDNNSWRIEGKGRRDIVSSAMIIPEGRTLFLANQIPKKREIKISWKFSSPVSIWDPDSGERFSLCPEQKGNIYSVNLTLAPHQSLYLFASPKKESILSLNDWSLNLAPKRREITTLSKEWHFKTETPNLFLPQLHIMVIKNKAINKEYSLPLWTDKRWTEVTRYGKTEIELSPENARFFWLQSKFVLKYIPEDLSVIVDSKDYEEIWLNGKRAMGKQPCNLWDNHNLKFSLKKYAHKGINLLTLRVKPSKYYSSKIRSRAISSCFIEPIVVSGSFRVKFEEDGREVLRKERGTLRSGSWADQGYPYFAGTGVYSQRIRITSLPPRVYIELEKVKEVVEVWVNGKLASIRPWPPYVVEISPFLRKGENEISLKVTNSFGNLLQSSYMGRLPKKRRVPAGILGKVKILKG